MNEATFRYASISCTDDRNSLTHRQLEIGNFACLPVLAPPLSYSIGWEYLSGLSSQSGQSGLSGLCGLSGHFAYFQLSVAHLWTDFQSC